MSELVSDDKWRLHPDWVYCQYNYAGDRNVEFDTPEENFKHFVAKVIKQNTVIDIILSELHSFDI